MAAKNRVKPANRPRLYLRLPVKVEEELQIKELHSNIVAVRVPRQSARWCIVEFDSPEKLEQARADLKKLEIKGKKIVVKNFKVKGEQKQTSKKKKVSEDSTKSLRKLLK